MKKEYILIIVVIVALGLYLFLEGKDQDAFQAPHVEALKSADIDSMIIKKGPMTLDLKKKDDKWFLQPEGFPADPAGVKNMLNAGAELRLTAVVSESGNYERYDLSDDKKINVQLFINGEKQRDFDIGRQAPTYQHVFVKLSDDRRVYHARGSLDRTFDRTKESLRDKNVLSFDQQTITAMELQKGADRIVLTKKELRESSDDNTTTDAADTRETPGTPETAVEAAVRQEWRKQDGALADKTAVERLLSAFSRLQCEAFVTDAAKEAFTDPAWSVTFKNDQDTFAFSLFGKQNDEEQRLPAISSTNDYPFLIQESWSQTLEKHINKLMGIDDAEEKKKETDKTSSAEGPSS